MAVKDPKIPSGSNGAPARPSNSSNLADGAKPYVRRDSAAGGRRELYRDTAVEDAGLFSMTGIRSGVLGSIGVKIMLGLLILIFAVGFALQSIGPATNLGPGASANGDPNGGPEVIARVGDETVGRDAFGRSYTQQVDFARQYGISDAGAAGLMDIRQRTVDTLSGEAAQVAEAKKRGIAASDEDIDKYITDEIDKGLKPQAGQSEASIRREIESQGTTIDAFKEKRRADYDRALVSRAVLLQKLEKAVKDGNKVSEEDYKRSVTKLALRQIKISPKQAAPGAKDPKADSAKGEADAKARVEKIAASLKGASLAQFSVVAKKESDDIATKALGGDLGVKLPAELPLSEDVRAPLVKATGSLVGPLQDPTSKDFYLFFVAGRKLDLPKDYAGKKAETLKTFEETQDNTAWSSFTTKLAAANKPQIEDPALVAYNIEKELLTAAPDTQKGLREKAIANYEQALTYVGGSDATSIRYHLAALYGQAGQPDKQIETLRAASEGSTDRAVKLELARALGNTGKKEEAIKLAQELSSDIDKSPSPPPQFNFSGASGDPDQPMRFQIAGLLEQLGSKDLAAKERAKIKPAQQPGMPAGMPGGLSMGGPGGGQVINIPRSGLGGKAGGKGGSPTINLGGVKVNGGRKAITIPAQSGKAAPAPAGKPAQPAPAPAAR